MQEKLAPRIRIQGNPTGVRHVAGVDLSCETGSDAAWAAVVVLSLKDLQTVEVTTARGQLGFPYVPGYLSFREGPVIWEAIRRVKTPVDLWFFDGQGLAHPRRFGLACHMGLLLGAPSIGVAKTLFIGAHTPVGGKVGKRAPLIDERESGGTERVGTVLRTRTGVKPVYVSPGHLVGIGPAADWTLRVTRKLRIPEPTRRAHMEVNKFRRGDG